MKFKPQKWVPLSDAYQDVTSVPGIPAGHIVLLRGHSDTGKADEEAIQMIQTQLNMANAHYTELVHARDILVGCNATLRTYSELTGRMFIEQQCLNKEQASAVRDRLVNEVALLDNIGWSNAWNYYNSVATALRMSHPKNWFEDQAACHSLITKYFALATLTEEPVHEDVQDIVQEPDNQLSIFDIIQEVAEPRFDEPASVIVEEFPQEFFEPQTSEPEEDFTIFEEPQTTTYNLPDL